VFFINQEENWIIFVEEMRLAHQGLVAEAEQLEDLSLKDFIKETKKKILIF
jgi:hypothetical protein